jgi:hypothetical protein
MFVLPIIEELSCKRWCSGKAVSITQTEWCFKPLVSNIQCACAILLSVACPALQYFSTLARQRHDFRKKKRKTFAEHTI